MKFEVGNRIGDYTLLARCGQGAYGVVFLAENVITGQKVALKVIGTSGRNYERELKGLRQYQEICRRTNLLQIYHVGSGEDFFYYTMDAADPLDDADYTPKTLANILKKKGKLSVEEIRSMADELIAALEVLHRKGMMHRDIKPENILWIEGLAVLGDIGLITDSGQTTLAGTPGFMSPEVLAGVREYRERDDFYALGKVLYCALTGLPVTQYPSFPESSTLTGAGEIIQLYSRLCAGEPIERKPRRRAARKIAYLAGILCLLTAFFFAGRYWRNTEQTQPTASEPAYVPSPEMLKLLPELRNHYQALEIQLHNAISDSSKHISAEELADAEKYLSLHPEHPMTGYPQLLATDRKHRRTEDDFDCNHRDDPVWRYFRNQQEIRVCIANTKDHVVPRRYSIKEARIKLRDLTSQQRTLEAEILKKYRK